jgi:hypothetical protein
MRIFGFFPALADLTQVEKEEALINFPEATDSKQEPSHDGTSEQKGKSKKRGEEILIPFFFFRSPALSSGSPESSIGSDSGSGEGGFDPNNYNVKISGEPVTMGGGSKNGGERSYTGGSESRGGGGGGGG